MEIYALESLVDSGWMLPDGWHYRVLKLKLLPKKTLPPRGPGGKFVKVEAQAELSDFSASGGSSPLDTPEVIQCTLEQEALTESEYEVNQQLMDDKDRDNESLPGATDPSTRLSIPEADVPAVPFPLSQYQYKPFILSVQAPYQSLLAPPPPYTETTGTNSSYTTTDSNSTNGQFERYIYLNHITNEATKVVIFSTFIYAGLEADIWWIGLPTSKKITWEDIKKEFEKQWPAIVVAVKFQLDYQKELLALQLKEEDIGEHITVAGVSMWSHLHYHSSRSVDVVTPPLSQEHPRMWLNAVQPQSSYRRCTNMED
ncbi:hypothetical protein EV424DRAFT_1539342 [Suillus variegatus]|nr:hypothetical protein EV424DRAFT_1539342 [Suillus variegatus]